MSVLSDLLNSPTNMPHSGKCTYCPAANIKQHFRLYTH